MAGSAHASRHGHRPDCANCKKSIDRVNTMLNTLSARADIYQTDKSRRAFNNFRRFNTPR